MATSTIIVVLVGLVLVKADTWSQHVFQLNWPNGTTVDYSFNYQRESQCIYDGSRDNLLCSQNYDYKTMVSSWNDHAEDIHYISLRCLQREHFTEHNNTCFCKKASMAADPHNNKERDAFTACQLNTLNDEVFQSLVNVELMDLSSNQVTNLPAHCFTNMKSMKYLNISNNPISNLPSELLCNLPKLRVLISQHLSLKSFPWQPFFCTSDFKSNIEIIDLSFSHISVLLDQSFQNLPILLWLRMANNRLTELPRAPFHHLTSLQFLDLSENLIFNISDDFCFGLDALEHLDTSGNSLQIIDFKSFSNCSRLIVLNLSQNRITTITINTTFQQPAMESLDLSDNELEIMKSNTFMNIFPNLLYMDISKNNLRSLHKYAFSGLENIQHLNLSWNQLDTSFTDVAHGLQGLFNLTVLDLSNNFLTDLQPRSFRTLINLKELMLQFNHIHDVSEITFEYLANLRSLSIDNNNIETLSDHTFLTLRSLRKLNLSRNSIRSVGDIAFPESLIMLDLSFNDVVDIPKGLDNIRSLLLNGNNITTILKQSFVDMSHLEVLDLSRNKIAVLEHFGRLPNLLSLDLSRNVLRTIDNPRTFAGLSRLRYLNVSNNTLNYFPRIIGLKSLQSLIEINLSNNPIRAIDYAINADGAPSELEKFDCKKCELSRINVNAFANLAHIRQVDVSLNRLMSLEPLNARNETYFNILHNPIFCSCNMLWLKQRKVQVNDKMISTSHYIIQNCIVYPRLEQKLIRDVAIGHFMCKMETCTKQCSCYTYDSEKDPSIIMCSKGLNKVPRDLPVSVRDIYLDGNDFGLTYTLQMIGKPFMKTEHIYLNNSQIYGLSTKVFANMALLKRINLSDNHISDMFEETFHNLHYLEEIYLGFNEISIITPGVFNGLVHLRILDLQANYIHHILPNTLMEFASFDDFRWIFVAGNPWKCDCTNRDFLDWILKHRSRIYDRRRTFCGETEILMFDMTSLDCQVIPYMDIGIGVSAAVSILIIAVLGIIMFNNRRNLVALGYSRYKIQNFHNYKKFAMRHEYLYDLVIIFDETDTKCRWWIMKTLIPRLTEHNWDFKIFLPHTENCSDDEIIHEVRHTIRHSQATLFLVSKHFPLSYICMKCFGLAKHECDHFGHLVLIITWGELTKEMLDSDINTFLRTGDYFKVNERFLVDKVIRSLPTPLSEKRLKSSTDHELRTIDQLCVTNSQNNLILDASSESLYYI